MVVIEKNRTVIQAGLPEGVNTCGTLLYVTFEKVNGQWVYAGLKPKT